MQNIQSGMRRRLIKDYRNYSFHRTFGAVQKPLLDVPLDYDAGLTMPDQVAEGYLYGCTGMTTADLGTDFDHKAYRGGYTYEKTCLMEGHGMDRGCYIINSLKSAIVYGLQAVGDDVWTGGASDPWSADKTVLSGPIDCYVTYDDAPAGGGGGGDDDTVFEIVRTIPTLTRNRHFATTEGL